MLAQAVPVPLPPPVIIIPVAVGVGGWLILTNPNVQQAVKDFVNEATRKIKDAVKDITAQGPRRFTPEQRAKGLEKAKDAEGVPRCIHCREELTTEPGNPNTYEADHRIPYSRGGPTTEENLDPTCRTCNRQKGLKPQRSG